MIPDVAIFIIGTFVTIIWGSMVGALLYAASNPVKNSGTDSDVERESNNKHPKASNA